MRFAETGHSVQGEFLRFWQSLREPLALLGYPITEAFTDTVTGRPTQYFQRARLDVVIKNGLAVVQQANLGSLLYDKNGAPANIPETGPTCRSFPATGYSVCYAFLQFYDQNEGPDHIGNPISGLEIRDGRIVQYFQKMRLEWQPSRPAGQRVVVGMLGRLAFDKYNGEVKLLEDNRSGNIGALQSNISKISTRAYVRNVLIPASGQQTVYIIVQDQDLRPVKGAQVSLSVIYPDRVAQYTNTQLTSAEGILVVNFQVGDYPVKQVVQLEVTVEMQGFKATTSTWFRIWY